MYNNRLSVSGYMYVQEKCLSLKHLFIGENSRVATVERVPNETGDFLEDVKTSSESIGKELKLKHPG